MFKRRTTLVLGAGASHNYDFPLARPLMIEIIDGLQPGGLLLRTLLKCDFREANLLIFRDELAKSGLPSVDHFLELRQEHLYQGKAAIAAALIPRERPENLALMAQRRWYEHLFQIMIRDVKSLRDFRRNLISFITFNYDRSLEYFFLTALGSCFGCAPGEAAEELGQIPIVHLYGNLGDLPELGKTNPRPYANVTDKKSVCDAADSILIPHEKEDHAIHEDQAFQDARSYLGGTEYLFFLGFGYHENALARLDMDSMRYIPNVHGTALRIGEASRAQIHRLFDRKIKLDDQGRDILTYLENCQAFHETTIDPDEPARRFRV